ncbi:Beta-barrel assembly machine subunit BamE [Rhodobacter aestuarii]|uniref:Beta-barrel assembly machine subunit BamE n=1 Tax=Rhodobacter aestuarii TaxID=453582 RepID=A0A1N7J714_9RHOB|nr:MULTISPECIES: outer membrane protein assembly factor BamE [Rhodobacter]PTV97115.1 Beta-barrel assembly machine subunit BamE [Rhodobacter aestuarii]SIS45102.1 Beta-barrel assembly machine subunit BamE [Rhodobacter aestuarii]SOB98564.1 Beta-barrel assembly machine subunit BamE [Rhodobacter sp. JA431]
MSSTVAPQRMAKKIALSIALVGMLAAASCTAIYRNHGYVPNEEDLAQIEVGKSNQQDVAYVIGRPASKGLLQGAGWFYVGSRWKHYGARAPQEVEREVVAVSFDDKGVVSNIERFGLEDGEVVVLSRRVTKSSIKGISVVRELLGSLGRVSAGQIVGD